MRKIFVTTDFCRGCKKIVDSNSVDLLNNLRTALISLANGWDLPSRYRDHQLKNSPYRELHISGDDLLLYRYENSDVLVLDLKLSDLTNHKGLRTKSSKDQHDYQEVDTQFLHDITSATELFSKADREFLNDYLESISDYASTYTKFGYILLDDYYQRNNKLHCSYDYYLYEDDTLVDSIDFVIDLSRYAPGDLAELDSYVDEFSKEIAAAFEE